MTQVVHDTDMRTRTRQLVVVTLTYGAGDEIDGLLNHLSPESLTTDHELIVVHNPSRPSERAVVSNRSDVCVLEMATNSGYAGGMNAGIEQALRMRPDFVLLLTHDVRISAAEVENLKTLLSEHSELAAIGPILCRSDGTGYSAGVVRHARIGMRYRTPVESMPRPIWPSAAIDGSVMMWRAAALRQVGGFDERFFMYFEDVEICARAARAGWGVAVATDLHAVSAPGGGNRRAAHAYLRARNSLAYSSSLGRSGLAAGLAECVVGLWHATPKPGGTRFGDPEARQNAATYWRGTLFGVLDYFRGHWGPPPPAMLRESDIAAI